MSRTARACSAPRRPRRAASTVLVRRAAGTRGGFRWAGRSSPSVIACRNGGTA